MAELDPQRVGDYFARPGTVAQWWTPDSGPLAFHYDAELEILDDNLDVDRSWRVLDLGTGRGRFGAYFARRGCTVVGLDINPEMLEIARETARSEGLEQRFEVREGGAEDLSAFDSDHFDLVVCMELFDHLPDLTRVLSEAARILKPGATLLFSYVPGESLYGAIGNVYRGLRRRFAAGETMISRTYSLAGIRSQLGGSGLDLEKYWGVGLLCVNAQTRLFTDNLLSRALTAVARAEARRWPYYGKPLLARHAAHVVGLARRRG